MSKKLIELEQQLADALPLDLNGLQVYVLSVAQLGPDFNVPLCNAYTCAELCPRCEPYLRSLSRWRGDGAVIVVSDQQEFLRGFSWYFQFGTLLHELAHTFDEIDLLPQARDYHSSQLSPPTVYQKGLDMFLSQRHAFDGHESRFIRAACHLRRRAADSGYSVPLDCLTVAGERYGLSPVGEYYGALGREIYDSDDIPLTQLLKTPEPPAFRELWRDDLVRYFQTDFRKKLESEIAECKTSLQVFERIASLQDSIESETND